MSLVNDMLLDLDERKSSAAERSELMPEPAPPATGGFWGKLTLVFACGFLVAGSAFTFRLLTDPVEPTSPVSETTTEPAAVLHSSQLQTNQRAGAPADDNIGRQSEEHAGPEAVAAEEAQVEATSATASEPVATPSAVVAPLLHAAEQALAEDRLTQPPVDNAFAYYRHVFLLDPGNADAQAGIERIQQRYRQMIEAAIDRKDWASGRTYLQRAQLVGMPRFQLVDLGVALSQLRSGQASESIEKSDSELAAAAIETQPLPRSEPTSPLEPREAGEQGTMSLSWRSREASALRQANNYLNRGQRMAAVQTLTDVVETYPRAESAAMMLFDLQLQAGNLAEAQRLQNLAQSSTLRTYYRAKLLSNAGQHAEALKVLEQSSPSGAAQEAYQALQAALYQRFGQYDQSVRIYQQLVQLDRRQPNYWLGLGVATEALGQRSQALHAFTAAAQLAPDDPAVSNYIKQRIQALSD